MSQTGSSDRLELYKSAIAFLNDESVSDAPLSKKIEFLQSKGLTQEEIDKALKEAESNHVVDYNTNKAEREFKNEKSAQYEAVPPPLPQRDWKDYFVMATASAGLCYGVYQLAKRYVIPNLLPESHAKLEQDKQEIMQQFDRMEQLLQTIESEHSSYVKKENEKFQDVDQVVVELQGALESTSRTREKLEDDVRIMRLEIEGLQKSLDTFITENSDSPAIRRLNDEILSLKTLFKSSDLLKVPSTPSDHIKSPVPGAEAIPSASEILSKMNIPKKNDSEVPAWKKSRDKSINDKSIPEWQKSTAEKQPTPIPEWQRAMLNAESPSPDDTI
ncbi:LANO_0H05864g1_1 [Lachancea nothofagi CBS 11611]|uniref:Peroxisomal membrane protein PEX14 n=1 Tax=Lachancea nothofagi CBS 11611 TaxID=1266666 RepID=A0A1G4KLT1_9SACH|nr:LANO_0H05864g1_1 [Lachancea nothofagi CBS 11611]